VEGLLKTAVVVLLKKKLVAVAGNVGVSTDAANYVTRTTFATPADVHSMSRGIEFPQPST
jgi:hypothetical protein